MYKPNKTCVGLYAENSKTLIKEDLNKQKDIPCSQITPNYHDGNIPKIDLVIQHNPHQNTSWHSAKTDKLMLKFIGKFKGQRILKKKNKAVY